MKRLISAFASLRQSCINLAMAGMLVSVVMPSHARDRVPEGSIVVSVNYELTFPVNNQDTDSVNEQLDRVGSMIYQRVQSECAALLMQIASECSLSKLDVQQSVGPARRTSNPDKLTVRASARYWIKPKVQTSSSQQPSNTQPSR